MDEAALEHGFGLFDKVVKQNQRQFGLDNAWNRACAAFVRQIRQKRLPAPKIVPAHECNPSCSFYQYSEGDVSFVFCNATGNRHPCGSMCTSYVVDGHSQRTCKITALCLGADSFAHSITHQRRGAEDTKSFYSVDMGVQAIHSGCSIDHPPATRTHFGEHVNGVDEKLDPRKEAEAERKRAELKRKAEDLRGRQHPQVGKKAKRDPGEFEIRFRRPTSFEGVNLVNRAVEVIVHMLYSEKRQQYGQDRIKSAHEQARNAVTQWCKQHANTRRPLFLDKMQMVYLETFVSNGGMTPVTVPHNPHVVHYSAYLIAAKYRALLETQTFRESKNACGFDIFVVWMMFRMATHGLKLDNKVIIPRDEFFQKHMITDDKTKPFGIKPKLITKTETFVVTRTLEPLRLTGGLGPFIEHDSSE